MERTLPEKGSLEVSVGDEVRSFTELGRTSSGVLLSGVWGIVEDIVPDQAALIRTFAVDLHLLVSTAPYIEGELIVFPNPSDLIQKQYFDKFSYSLEDKVVYTGNNVSLDILKIAESYGVAGILTGGCNRKTFDYARERNLFLGLFSGFGNSRTPDIIFDVLNDLSTRTVFVSGEERYVRIPVSPEFDVKEWFGHHKPDVVFRDIKRGSRVLVLQNPWFGESGHVLEIVGGVVIVKLSGIGNTIEVNIPNIFAIN